MIIIDTPNIEEHSNQNELQSSNNWNTIETAQQKH